MAGVHRRLADLSVPVAGSDVTESPLGRAVLVRDLHASASEGQETVTEVAAAHKHVHVSGEQRTFEGIA